MRRCFITPKRLIVGERLAILLEEGVASASALKTASHIHGMCGPGGGALNDR